MPDSKLFNNCTIKSNIGLTVMIVITRMLKKVAQTYLGAFLNDALLFEDFKEVFRFPELVTEGVGEAVIAAGAPLNEGDRLDLLGGLFKPLLLL